MNILTAMRKAYLDAYAKTSKPPIKWVIGPSAEAEIQFCSQTLGSELRPRRVAVMEVLDVPVEVDMLLPAFAVRLHLVDGHSVAVVEYDHLGKD